MYICLCSGLKYDKLKNLIKSENGDIEKIIEKTGAAKKCGKCKKTIKEIIRKNKTLE